jgi:hypothetical protein
MARVLCLHTAAVHVATFDRLFAAAAPDVAISHVVRAEWLAAARQSGLSESLRHEVLGYIGDAARDNDAVLCSCSTLGPLVSEAAGTDRSVIRIDDPLMEAAAAFNGTVLVAFCLESTRASTLALLAAACHRLGTTPRVEAVSCAAAWPHFERGDNAAFGTAIADRIVRALPDLSGPVLVVLAQASMAAAEPVLAGMGVTALSSPRLAVDATLSRARQTA